jgi:hypothetical protein
MDGLFLFCGFCCNSSSLPFFDVCVLGCFFGVAFKSLFSEGKIR